MAAYRSATVPAGLRNETEPDGLREEARNKERVKKKKVAKRGEEIEGNLLRRCWHRVKLKGTVSVMPIVVCKYSF